MCFAKLSPEPVELEPTSTQEISYDLLTLWLANKFPNVPLFISHEVFRLCHYDDVAKFLAQDQTNKYGYDLETYRCSDFALRLAGQFSIPKWANLTKGLVWTNTHALNCIITEDMKFFFVEPQTDEIEESLPAWAGSLLRFIMV